MNMRVHTAIAYIKPHIPSDDPAPVVSLGDDHSPILREFAPGLLTAYLVDDGEKFSYVQGRDLRAVGMPEEELHWLAVANLAELADGKASIRQSSRVWTLFFDGNFEASLMLLDDLWTNSLRVYAPDPIVAIPARDVLAFCNVESADGIAELRAVVERVCCLWATTSCRRAFIVVLMENGGSTKSSNSRLLNR